MFVIIETGLASFIHVISEVSNKLCSNNLILDLFICVLNIVADIIELPTTKSLVFQSIIYDYDDDKARQNLK